MNSWYPFGFAQDGRNAIKKKRIRIVSREGAKDTKQKFGP